MNSFSSRPVSSAMAVAAHCQRFARPRMISSALLHPSLSQQVAPALPLFRQHQTRSESNKRNPVLAAVIREGLAGLHETATLIQASKQARQALLGADKTEVTPQHKYYMYHIQQAVLFCLEEWVEQQEQTPTKQSWSIQGEPVEILNIKLSSSLQHAVIYWTLPYSLVVPTNDDEMTTSSNDDSQMMNRLDAILELQQKLHQQWTRQTHKNPLCLAIQSRLRNYNRWNRIPELRLEPATPWMLGQFLMEQAKEEEKELE